MDRKTYNKAYKKLIRRAVTLLSLLFAIFFSKQFVIQYQIAQELNTSHVINTAGRQRMLSQKIVKDIVFIHRGESTLKDEEYKEDLETSLELWKKSHLELLEEENNDISQKLQDIQPVFDNIAFGTQGFLKGLESSEEDSNQQDAYVNQVSDNEVIYLEKMDSIVLLYEAEAIRSVKSIKTTHLVLFLLIMAILIFMIFTVLMPLLKYVDNAYWKVSEGRENLIKIFHSMKGALFLIKRDGEILFMNSDAENITSKGIDPKEPLYLDTSVKWIAFDIKKIIEQVKNDDVRIEDVETTIKDKDGNLITVIMSALSGVFDGHDVVVVNLFDITAQKKAEEILKNTALKDELTGLYNRHFLESIIDGEIKRSQRYAIPLSAAILDLDYFKRVNDKWGHPVGDTVLKFTADIVQANIRESDFAIRIGGEEFLILMPNTDSKGALIVSEKIRKAIEDSVHPVVGRFTASFGVAERMNDEKYQYLYERVDEALYQAKENGRNQVMLAQSESCEYPTVSFEWNEKWSSGEDKIDKQHKDLFQEVSQLVKYSKTSDDKESIIKQLKNIISSVGAHFKYEESVLNESNYKGVYEHKKIHTQLIKRSNEIIDDLKKDELDPQRAVSIIFDEVIVGHLLCEDVKFFPYI